MNCTIALRHGFERFFDKGNIKYVVLSKAALFKGYLLKRGLFFFILSFTIAL
jgi:hypothetical protein